MNYTKQWTNAEKTEWVPVYIYEDGREQIVSKTKPEFMQFLESEGTMEERDYVAPPPPIDPYIGLSPDARILRKVKDRLFVAGYTDEIIAVLTLNKLSNRNPEEFDAMNVLRLQLIEQAYEEETSYA